MDQQWASTVHHGLKVSVALGLLTISLAAKASVVLEMSRVIYPAGAAEASVKLTNVGDRPALIQSWLDRGNLDLTPDNKPSSDVPFIITPPLFRIEPHKGQTMQLVYTQEPLPKDRESVFWLNVMEVPPKPDQAESGQNTLQFAVRSRIKVFFRPNNLVGSSFDTASQSIWSIVPSTTTGSDSKSAGYSLQVQNPSAYHLSLTSVEVQRGTKRYSNPRAGMAAPKSTLTIPLMADSAASKDTLAHSTNAPVKILYHYIDDFGAERSADITLK